MLLTELFDLYEMKRLRGRSANTIRLYHHAMTGFGKTLGRKPTIDDLTDDAVEMHMWRLVKNGGSPASANKDRSQLLAMWRFALQRGIIVGRWPDVQPLPEVERTPLGWLPDELERLFRSCRRQQGTLGGAPASLWWLTLVLVLIDTGERIGAVRPLQKSSLQDHWLHVPAALRKGKRRDRVYPLRCETVEKLELLRKAVQGQEMWPWPHSATYLWGKFKRVLLDADLPTDRQSKFHRMRRTVASAVQRAGGDATAALDHASPKTTKKYLDPRIVGGEAVSDVLARYLRDPDIRKPPRRDSA